MKYKHIRIPVFVMALALTSCSSADTTAAKAAAEADMALQQGRIPDALRAAH